MIGRRRIYLSALAGVAVAVAMCRSDAQAQPLVTGDLTIYYDFDNFTDVVMDGSGNGFNGKVRDATRNMTDEFERGLLTTTGVISNDKSNPKRGAGAIRFMQPEVATEDPVFVDMDGGVIKTNSPTKVPTTKVTYAAWVNLEPVNAANGWNSPASIVQGSRLGGHGVPHLHAEGAGTIRLAIRNESGQNIVDSSGAPFSGHPYPNQPEIDSSGAAPEPWPANEWFHLAVTYDKDANGGVGDFAMYYNGTEIRGGDPNGPGVGTDIGAWDFQQFGNYYDGLGLGAVYDSGGRRIHGMLDELYIFTRALSPAEIQTLVNIAPPGLTGDYNNNGTVDAADYVAWRDAGPTATLPNDATPGTVDQTDYDVWRANFGKPTVGSASGNIAVPEPVSVTLLLVCLATLAGQRRR
jgi:hypothetical protein